MDISQFFMDYNNSMSKEDLIKITSENFEQIKELSNLNITYDFIKKLLNSKKLDIENLYISKKGLRTFWYISGFAYLEILTLSKEYLDMYPIDKLVKQENRILTNAWNEKDYNSFFSRIEQRFAFSFFTEHINEIPEEKLYRIFRKLYVKSDYGFNKINYKLIEKIFLLNKDKNYKKKLTSDRNGYMTIYRGMTEKSTNIDKSYSWTTDIDTAIYFATRFNSLNSKIYKASIRIDNIIDYVDTRNESEVLLLSKDLENIEKLDYYNLNEELITELTFNGYIDYYNHLKSLINEEWFDRPNGIHGVMHIKRTLFLTLILSYFENLNSLDSDILAYSVLLHDIGRDNDNKDNEHGVKSVKKIEELKLYKSLNMDFIFEKEDNLIINYIIKNHAIKDSLGIENVLNEEFIKDKDRAVKLLKLFKDCDNLDRVRISDLNIKYLRSDSAKKMVLIAHQLLANLR
ncbi:MAG: metal dependent phosphohydrolase [Clostridiaceae bacterium]|nr:metal dependent phosphohydrolase [Clostridiaceae bacterium]